MASYDNPIIIPARDAGRQFIFNYPEASSQTFVSNQFVCLVDDSGTSKVTLVASDGNPILGIVSQNASTVEDTSLEVQVINNLTLIEISYTDTTGLVVPVEGKSYGLVTSGGKCKLDIDEVTTDFFRVIKVVDTTAKRCLVHVIPAKCQLCVSD
jgi:hypothetical protein